MHCKSCELLVEQNVKQVPGVTKVHVNQAKGLAEIYFHQTRPTLPQIAEAVKTAGYELGEKEKLPWLSRNGSDYKTLFKAALILLSLYLVAKWTGLAGVSFNPGNSGLFVALLVGLVAGISTCMALVGGLVLSLSARHAELHPEATSAQKFRPHIFFNLGRIFGFSLLGGLAGLAGSIFRPSPNVMGILTILIGGVMIFFGLKLVEIFPSLRDKNISLPAGVAKIFGLHKETKEYSHRGAIIMGALSFFLPCGFTQAMQLYAVSTGSFWQGALIMFLFALGTAPGLLGIGGLASVVKGKKARLFFATAGLTVITLGLFNITNGSHLISKPTIRSVNQTVVSQTQPQQINMTQGEYGYQPNIFTVKVGQPVKWVINSTSFSCASYIVMTRYGISQPLRPGQNIIEFIPNELGQIPFSCSMGMYRGVFNVVS